MQIGIGFIDVDLEKYVIFFKDYVIEKFKLYYRYDFFVELDYWFDVVQVWEVKCVDFFIFFIYFVVVGIVSIVDLGLLVYDFYNYWMLYYNIKDLKGFGYDFRSKFYFLFFICKMVYLYIFND